MEVILPFFSMVQKRNRMHQENIEKLPERYPMFLKIGRRLPILFAAAETLLGEHVRADLALSFLGMESDSRAFFQIASAVGFCPISKWPRIQAQ